ncbi:MAG: SCO family protein [Bacteroidota bacterium]|nr:SCO family protein [Bacteroidota bacterium]
MRILIAALFSFSFFLSCSNGNEKVNGDSISYTGIERLQIYYKLDSTDAKGNACYHTIPEVELTAQNGKPFLTSSYKGKISLTDFFFASCMGTCPRMTSQLTRVQDAFRNNPEFKIVSYTVDPDRDTAASLQQYAGMYKADTSQWKFVTGPKKELYDLARYGYFLPVAPGNGDSEDFIHSDQFVLVDRQSHIRGYYNGTDSASVDSLIADIKVLLNQK